MVERVEHQPLNLMALIAVSVTVSLKIKIEKKKQQGDCLDVLHSTKERTEDVH